MSAAMAMCPDSAPNDALLAIPLQNLAALQQKEREMAAATAAMEVRAAKLRFHANHHLEVDNRHI
jgi:hypothetical protein